MSYERENWAPNWEVSGVIGYYDIKEKSANPYYTLFPAGACVGSSTNCFPNGMIGNPSHAEQHTHASLSAVYTGFEQHRLRIGTGYRIEDLYEATEVKNFDSVYSPLPGLVESTGDPALSFISSLKLVVSFVVPLVTASSFLSPNQ
jgi:iron complex outermembrane receptor protein